MNKVEARQGAGEGRIGNEWPWAAARVPPSTDVAAFDWACVIAAHALPALPCLDTGGLVTGAIWRSSLVAWLMAHENC